LQKQRARRFRFVVAVFPIRTRGKKRDFSEKEHKKEILSRFFSCSDFSHAVRCWFPPSANLILSSQKVASFVEILSAYMVDQLVFYEVTPSYV
jgi:iron only hydrogenase large subunit-like protein